MDPVQLLQQCRHPTRLCFLGLHQISFSVYILPRISTSQTIFETLSIPTELNEISPFLQTLESFCRICILTKKNVKLFSITFFAITHPFDGLVGNPDSSQFQICDESIPGLCSNTFKKRLLLKTWLKNRLTI